MQGYAAARSPCGYGGCGGGRSPRGYALAAFGLFGAFDAKFELVDGIGFNEDWTNNDFNGGGWAEHIKYWFKLSYTPISQSFLTNATNKMLALKSVGEMGNGGAYQQYETFRQQLSSLCDQADKLTKTANTLGQYSDATHKNRYANFNAIQSLIKQISFISVPQPPPQEVWTPPASPPAVVQPPPTTQAQPPPTTTTKPPPTTTGTTASTGSTSDGGSSGPPAKSGLPLGVILPVGGAVVIAALLLLLPKKKRAAAPAMAGYRRRRRRR